jgi:translin
MNLETIVESVIARLDETNQARETALATSRSLIRQCANAIRATHRHEWETAEAMLVEADRIAGELRARLTEHSAILNAGYSQDALKEYAEARLVYAMVRGTALPGPDQIAVEPAAYLNGLAEAASELRRYILDGLRKGDVTTGEQLLSIMDDVYSRLVTVDYPDAVTGGLRRTTDALRAVLERTRGDLTAAIRQDHLMVALSQVEARLAAQEEAQDR